VARPPGSRGQRHRTHPGTHTIKNAIVDALSRLPAAPIPNSLLAAAAISANGTDDATAPVP
jgi:hypothetical protein